ncbi:MAG TPA: nucleoside hydrolase [Rhodothermales bacterium]|nr:nucleoside hydrolase [Rhodothermales bacterium]
MLPRLSFLLALCCLSLAVKAQPVRLIFDTDMGNDVDDALALAIIHALESRGEAKLLAVTVTKDNKWAAPYIDAVNTFYGRGDVPIGVVKDGKTPDDRDMIRVPAGRRNADGSYVYPHDLVDGTTAPDAVSVLRKTLAAEPDSAVTIVQVGFSTNLARLLDSGPDQYSPLNGRALVRRKVRLLSMMAGAFPEGNPEYNVVTDIPAARHVFADWPTPIITSGFEVGATILYPVRSILWHYGYVPDHPIVDAYKNLLPMPYDRPTWDLTAVLYAVRPDGGYFDLSEPGTIGVRDDGCTYLVPARDGQRRYLKVDDIQRARILEAEMELASQPPDRASIP